MESICEHDFSSLATDVSLDFDGAVLTHEYDYMEATLQPLTGFLPGSNCI